MKSASVGQVPQHMCRSNTSLMGNPNTKHDTQIENDIKKHTVVSGFVKVPKKDAYTTQLHEVPKPSLRRFLPQFTVHFASVAFKSDYRKRNLRRDLLKDKHEDADELVLLENVVELESKTDNSGPTRRIFLENKAKSADYVAQYRPPSKGVLVYQGHVQFGPPIKLKTVEGKTKKRREEENSSRNDALKHFGKYSPKNSTEKLTNKSKHHVKTSPEKPVEKASPKNKKHPVDELVILNTKIVLDRNSDLTDGHNVTGAEPCAENYEKIKENCEKICCQARKFFEKKSNENKAKVKSEDSESKNADDEEKDWEISKFTEEFSEIQYPKETKNAVALMLSDIKTFNGNDKDKCGKTSVEESILKFNNMSKQDKKLDKEDKIKSSKKKSVSDTINRDIDCECSRTSSKCDKIKNIYKNNSRLDRSESSLSSLSRGISCRSLFYDKTKKPPSSINRKPSHTICKRNSSSYIESTSSLSTDVSYCRVQRLFQNMISESKNGRLRRFRRNISGYKEMDRLGLGTWDNRQWRPSDSKAYTIFNRFQKNVNGFQGDFTKCKRKD